MPLNDCKIPAIALTLIIAALFLTAGCVEPEPPETPEPTPPVTEKPPESPFSQPSGLAEFAQCLTDRGITVYTAWWAEFSERQKELFGDSWKYLAPVECSLPNSRDWTTVCSEAGVTGVPTWKAPDGRRLVGLVTLAQLAQFSGCALPPTNGQQTPQPTSPPPTQPPTTPPLTPARMVDLPPQKLLLTMDQFPLTDYNLTDDSALGNNGWGRTFGYTSKSSAYWWVNPRIYLLDSPAKQYPSADDACQGWDAKISAIKAPIIGDHVIACKITFPTNTRITPIFRYRVYTRNVIINMDAEIRNTSMTDDQVLDFLASLAQHQMALIDRAAPPSPGIVTASTPKFQFNSPSTLTATAGEDFKYSFCDPAPSTPTSPCGPIPATKNPTGGNQSYRFVLGPGTDFPPFSLSLSKEGVLKGKVHESETGKTHTLEVCAIDLSDDAVCRNVTIIVEAPLPPPPPTPPPPKPTKIVISPNTSTLNIGDTVQFTATVLDQYDNVLPDYQVTWSIEPSTQSNIFCSSCGSVTSTGLFTATGLGPLSDRIWDDYVIAGVKAQFNVDGSTITGRVSVRILDPVSGQETITDGGSMTVQCGSGSEGGFVQVVGKGVGSTYYSTINQGERTEMQVEVVKYNSATYKYDIPSGAQLTWKLYDQYGGKLSVNGCTATYRAPDSIGARQEVSVTVTSMFTTLATPPESAGEGGPRSMTGASATGKITVRNPNYGTGGGGGAGGLCGNEWLQVSISGPYSYSQNVFWLNGPGTNYQWVGPYVNARTFQPITPGTYTLSVDYADGPSVDYEVTVPQCSYYKFIKSNQGWGQ